MGNVAFFRFLFVVLACYLQFVVSGWLFAKYCSHFVLFFLLFLRLALCSLVLFAYCFLLFAIFWFQFVVFSLCFSSGSLLFDAVLLLLFAVC